MSQTQYEWMDLIVANLTGPMKVETWSGMQYALVTVKVSSRYGVVHLLKSKDEAPAVLREVIAMIERQSGQKLKKLRTDNVTTPSDYISMPPALDSGTRIIPSHL